MHILSKNDLKKEIIFFSLFEEDCTIQTRNRQENITNEKETYMIRTRLKMVLTQSEMDRITIFKSSSGTIHITVDVHGMKCYEARRFINNIINIVRMAFQLVIIHGYNHGTAIKEMLAHNFSNEHICEQFNDSHNQGVTHMLIAA